MKPLPAIVQVTLRAALRERVVWSMLALVVGSLLLLPLGLRGDGTLESELRMHLRYSMGVSTALLAGMTLWIACSALAGDLSSKRLQLVLTKPVSRFTLWWGKWIAVCLISLPLLFLSGWVTLLRVEQRLADPAAVTPEQRRALRQTQLSARRMLLPEEVDVREEAAAMLAEQQREGRIPPGLSPADLARIERDMFNMARALRHSARAGESVAYVFHLPEPVQPGEALQLGFQLDSGIPGTTRIPGIWRLGTPEDPSLLEIPLQTLPAGEALLNFPADSGFTGTRTLVAAFENQSETGGMIFFRPAGGVVLFRPGGSFAPNFFRALLLLSGLLALLAALGVSCGGFFSLPVACYTTAMVLVLQAFSGTLESVLTDGTPLSRVEDPGLLILLLDAIMLRMYQGLDLLVRAIDLAQPLQRVARGILIPPAEVLRVLLARVLPVLLLLAALGGWGFHRREVGVAE